ncbi:MAG: hypothetical protein AB4426_04165 [Xenococcaceae cyanobacterium]
MSQNSIIDVFGTKQISYKLDRIKWIVERCQECKEGNWLYLFLFAFLVPGSMIANLQIEFILRSQEQLKENFRGAINKCLFLIVIASISYFVMLFYFLPSIGLSLWNLFHQIYDWEQFFESLMTWKVFQTLCFIIPIQFFFAWLALSSFKVTDTFDNCYENLKKLADEQAGKYIVVETARIQMVLMLPKIVENTVNHHLIALMNSENFTPEQLSKIQQIMNDIHQSLNQLENNNSINPILFSQDYQPDYLRGDGDNNDNNYGDFR